MKRLGLHQRLRIFLTAGLSTVLLSHCSNPGPGRSSPPNILVAIADDWSWPHAGAYGEPAIKTPVFDRLAGEGVLFTNAFVSSPSCTPSRAAVLTGQWHWRLEESANLWSTLQAKFPVYPDLLEERGYFVGYAGKGWGPGQIEPGGRSRNPAGPQFSSFQAFQEARPPGQPFCFWFGSSDPHRPYDPGSGAASGVPLESIRVPAFLPEVQEVRGDLADYFLEVQRFDQQVGQMLLLLQELGELDNTLIVVTSDNGMPFPRSKGNLYDSGTRVPLVVRWADSVPGGRVVSDFLSLTDLAPTFLEAARVSVPEQMSGRSLLEILRSGRSGRLESRRDSVLTGKERHVPSQEAPDPGGTPMRAIRSSDFLYIRNFKPDRWPAGTPHYERAFLEDAWYGDVDNGPSKLYMIQKREEPAVAPLYERAFSRRPPEELYDLSKDPDQLHNVADLPQYQETKKRLWERLEEQLRLHQDPRILGQGEVFDTFPYYGGAPTVPPGWKQGQ